MSVTPVLKPESVRRRVSILGSTGSIGCNTLDLIGRHRDAYEVVALTAQSNVKALADQAKEFDAELAVIGDDTCLSDLRDALAGTGIECAAGRNALEEAGARPADWVMAAIVGTAGLAPTLAAVRQGAHVALANKECLVSAGNIFLAEVAESGATLLPADSEHNAIFQVLDPSRLESVDKIILTASGGPFLETSMEDMRKATPAQAVAHPQWSMGAKISVDSATLMNKGLELIEAHYLFPVGREKLDVVIHPQSIIHSMVAYNDGSVLAQLGSPDMRTPISYTLAWPERMATPADRLNLAEIGQLTFRNPDLERFPALALAAEALKLDNGSATVMNAANEIAVAAFLAERIGFLDISALAADVMEGFAARKGVASFTTLDDVLDLDDLGRQKAQEWVQNRAS